MEGTSFRVMRLTFAFFSPEHTVDGQWGQAGGAVVGEVDPGLGSALNQFFPATGASGHEDPKAQACSSCSFSALLPHLPHTSFGHLAREIRLKEPCA